MTYCGTCSHLVLIGYPKHAEVGLYRCGIDGSFYTLTKPNECPSHKLTDNIEARRELVRGRQR
jgi:hypothetical protein